MKIFGCPACAAALFFDNQSCERCNTVVAYDLANDEMVLDNVGCVNRYSEEWCNWVADADVCASCATDVDHTPTSLRRPFQQAKRRTLRQLFRHRIDLTVREPTLRFDLRAGGPDNDVVTGHDGGLVTIDVSEGNAARREELRMTLGEPYRTPLGHVRHEVGHWWWSTARDAEFGIDEFRARFGDETTSYSDALQRHYSSYDDGSWRDRFVSFYAASHPWEDFAESFAHALHIDDTLETAAAHSLGGASHAAGNFDASYRRWVALTATLNELNRSMGLDDGYPFAPSNPAIKKIAFVSGTLSAEDGLG